MNSIYIKFFAPLVLITMVSFACKKETIELCDTEACNTYLEVWENLLKQRNNLSDTYFNDHIKVLKTSINEWNEGESFRVRYQIKIDWMEVILSDHFMIKIDSANAPPYPSLDVSRTNYLTQDEVNQVI